MAAALGLVAGCTSSSADSTPRSPGADGKQDAAPRAQDGPAATGDDGKAACAELARARCERKITCEAAVFEFFHATMADCLEDEAATCLLSLTIGGSQRTVEHVRACIEGTRAAGCYLPYDWTPNTPGCEDPPGLRQPMQGCHEDIQCASLLCGYTFVGQSCGRCVPTYALGEACDRDRFCRRPLYCKQGRCAARSSAGEPCEDQVSCGGETACRDGKCIATLPDGDACQGIFECRGRLSDCVNGTCMPAVLQGPGGKCLDSAAPVYGQSVFCKAGLDCPKPDYVCGAAEPKAGEACDTHGPSCQRRAWCIGAVCRLPEELDCPADPPTR